MQSVRYWPNLEFLDRFSSPVSNFTKIQPPTTCGQMDGRMVRRKDRHDDWRILIRRSGLVGGFKTPSICLSAIPDLPSAFSPLMNLDLERLLVTSRPTGRQHCRRSCRPSTARRSHGCCSAAIPNPAYRQTDRRTDTNSEVPRAVATQIAVFRVVTPCSVV